jgi:hypothetical protein
MVEDALSLQFAIMQVIRALHDRAIDSRTAALTLYGLQIASGNLKRFAAEHSSVANDPAREQSLLELLVEQLQIPMTPEELLAELNAEPVSEPPIPAATITNSPGVKNDPFSRP